MEEMSTCVQCSGDFPSDEMIWLQDLGLTMGNYCPGCESHVRDN